MDTWYELAQRSLIMPGCGPHIHGPYRIVFHTTEGHTLQDALDTYPKTRNYPHFTVDGKVVEQHTAIDQGATALEHPAGTPETNRASAVQIEIVGFSEHLDQISPDTIQTLQELTAWIMLQTGAQPYWPVSKPYPASYGDNGIRLSAAQWATWSGCCGHEHVPHNDHGDPGALDLRLFIPLPAPIPQEDDDMANLTIEWPDGAKSIATNDGAIDHWPLAAPGDAVQPAPSYGSFYSLRPDERQALNWPLKGDLQALCPVDINNKAAGVIGCCIGTDGKAYNFKFDAAFKAAH